MFEVKKVSSLNDYFKPLSRRTLKNEVYFCRINGCNEEIKGFVKNYYNEAVKSGCILQGKIKNPDENNLKYYEDIMGISFEMNSDFIYQSLQKWLPRISAAERQSITVSMYNTLNEMKKIGKNENILKNAYIKFMCWFYYKFESVVIRLGNDICPKILYEGEISNYELKMLSILAHAGCDIVLLQNDDSNYLKLDSSNQISYPYMAENSLKLEKSIIDTIRDEIQEEISMQRLYGGVLRIKNCTNAWMEGRIFEDILKEPGSRGKDSDTFYNGLCRISGVEDKITYVNELYQFYLKLKSNGRNVVVVENEMKIPSVNEINCIQRGQYSSENQMIESLSANINYFDNKELEAVAKKAFVDILKAEGRKSGMNINNLTNKAVYVLCWLKRYGEELFKKWTMPKVGCFIYFGGCRCENEALFIKVLSRLPVDVLILNYNLNNLCCFKDELLYEEHFGESLAEISFPKDGSQVQIATAAYNAERDLDTIIYEDSGIYRNRQYSQAKSICLTTMYEEIPILWNEKLKYRPNFSVINNVVNVPVIFAKVSGVKEGNIASYWLDVKKLITKNTFVVKEVPFINSTSSNPLKRFATDFLRNGRLQREVIKNNKDYKYSFLREEVQNRIFDNLQYMIDEKIIKGTFENGTEYTVISTILNLDKDIVRMIQNFDFTKENPKLIYINTTENIISLEDSIMTAFLNLIGFDIVFFIPTGYQCIEKYFNKIIIKEHQIGDYIYDLLTPDFDTVSFNPGHFWEKIFFKTRR